VPTFTKRGATVALVEYDLCPQVTVTDIVRQTRASIAWVAKNIMRYSGDPSRIFVSGHSAGGHLTAMALAHDWAKDGLPQNCIKGAVATSGVFDLDMVMKISVQQQVRMTPDIAKLNSPFLNPAKVNCPLVVAVGGAEPKGWQQMSEDYFNYAKQQGMNAEYLVVPGANHYTMAEKLLDETNPLTQAMIKQMKI
jgi:arylformamidase